MSHSVAYICSSIKTLKSPYPPPPLVYSLPKVYKQEVWAQIWFDKEFKLVQKLMVFPIFIIYTLEPKCKTKAPMGLRGYSDWSVSLTKSGFSRL